MLKFWLVNVTTKLLHFVLEKNIATETSKNKSLCIQYGVNNYITELNFLEFSNLSAFDKSFSRKFSAQLWRISLDNQDHVINTHTLM